MSEIGFCEPEANGMTTSIVVVDGVDGLTPDMLRRRTPLRTVAPRTGAERWLKDKTRGWYF